MSDPKTWPRVVRIQANGHHRLNHRDRALSLVYLAAFVAFCISISVYRRMGGTNR